MSVWKSLQENIKKNILVTDKTSISRVISNSYYGGITEVYKPDYFFYCLIVISIEPIIANKSIIDVNINHKGKLVYIILPMLVI